MLRTAVFKPTNDLVAALLQSAADRIDAAYEPKLGEQFKGRERLVVQCMFGSFELQRNYYYHPNRKYGYYPVDAALGLETGCTPALARLVTLEGSDEISYQKAQMHLLETGGIAVEERQIHRIMQRIGPAAQAWQAREAIPEGKNEPNLPVDRIPVLYVSADGTGVPMRKSELTGIKGKQADGTAKTRQAYLGCVFTQHGRDEKGCPVRDYNSTTYVSHLGCIHDFAPMLRQEAIRRGMGVASEVVILIDGAEGLECMGISYFPGRVQIVDFFHAMEHAGLVLQSLLKSKDHPDYKPRLRRWAKSLLKNGVDKLIDGVRAECSGKAHAPAVEKELGYFVRNSKRMQYGSFRKAGYFIGSGVVEAGCKTVIGARCKQSGMHWSTSGAQNILAFRCINASHRLNDFWRFRLNQRTALNRAA